MWLWFHFLQSSAYLSESFCSLTSFIYLIISFEYLKELNIKIEDIEEVVIAGAFGYHIDAESIKTIGLIPKGFNGSVTFVGNSSVEGAALAAINDDILNKMVEIKEKIDVIELSTKDDFQEYFIGELNF